MTQYSYLWEGVVTGDATAAPYAKDVFNTFISGIHLPDVNAAYVIPGYLNDLEPLTYNSASGFSVTIRSGAALYKNYLFVSDADVSFQLDRVAVAGTFRYDLITLKVDSTEQKLRLRLVKGTETDDIDLLANPTISANEIILARILVNDLNSYIADYYVQDYRKFALTNYALTTYGRESYNLIKNSEFMAYSASVNTNAPDGWRPYGTTTFSETTKLSPMSRGRAISYSGQGMYQIFRASSLGNGTITVKGVLKSVTEGDIIRVSITGAGTTKVKDFSYYPDGEEIEFQFTYRTNQENVLFYLYVYGISSDTATVGQIIVVNGYHPGPFRQFSEMIGFETPVTDTSWDGDAKSTGATTIDLSADFGANILDLTKAVMLHLRCRDSGSLAGVASIIASGSQHPTNYGMVEVSGITNDVWRDAFCIVPVNQLLAYNDEAEGKFILTVAATGAGTLDAIVEITGIIT